MEAAISRPGVEGVGTTVETLNLDSCPPIFVLPTHLGLDELHDVEETLTNCNAPVTYDITEAAVVLGRVSHKKRAALELRMRGLWTEEDVQDTGVSVVSQDMHPPRKRRHNEGPASQDAVPGSSKIESSVIDLSTESEDEEGSPHHRPRKHIKMAKRRGGGSSKSPASSTPPGKSANNVKVVSLEWLNKSLEEGCTLSLEPYIIYSAHPVPRPEGAQRKRNVASFSFREPKTAQPPPGSLRRGESDSKAILERAKVDAALASPPTQASNPRRSGAPRDRIQAHARPKLLRQTTSEDEMPLPPVPDWVRDNVLYACLRSSPLNSPNEQFLAQLAKVKKVRALTLDDIGVRAYSTSIAAIAAYPYPLKISREVLSLPGCDAKIAALFSEWKDSDNGTIAAANSLDEDPELSTLSLFNDIWGVGPKTAHEFYHRKQWRDLDDIVEFGWNSLSRVQQIGVKYFDEFKDGIPRKEIEQISDTILKHARAVRPGCEFDDRGMECIIVGGYRRGKDTCGDVDLILSHRDERVTENLIVDVVGSLEKEGYITHTLSLHLTSTHREQQTLAGTGTTKHHFDSLDKALVVWQDPNFRSSPTSAEPPTSDPENESNPQSDAETEESRKLKQKKRAKKNPNIHRRVDIIISPWRTIGCAIVGWTGDTTFERDLRRYAEKSHGWKFDSSGVRVRGGQGKVVDLEEKGGTWEERERLVMEGLGVGWRPPEERCTR
ncbi:hypothetical protein FQN54_000757 [Arachnomyces sp. PD_36]|nr:hypothetical protein FQN54_000757 [Arachnomyces sp. PD_36]